MPRPTRSTFDTDLLSAAVEVALAIRARGGMDALPSGDPLRRKFALAVAHVAGLDRLPLSRQGHAGNARDGERYQAAALAVASELRRRDRLAAAGAR